MIQSNYNLQKQYDENNNLFVEEASQHGIDRARDVLRQSQLEVKDRLQKKDRDIDD